MDEAITWALRAMSPGMVCLALGAIFSIQKARFRRTSRWGIRLSALGLSLSNLVPGVVLLIATIRGQLLWPAAIAGLTFVAFGAGFLAVLRQNWASRASDSNSSALPLPALG
jgi:hypothetical protein